MYIYKYTYVYIIPYELGVQYLSKEYNCTNFCLCFLSEKFYLPFALIFLLAKYQFQIFLNILSILPNLFFPERLSFWWSPSCQVFKQLSSWDFINCFLNLVHYLKDIIFPFHDVILYLCVVHPQVRNATKDLNSWVIDSAYTLWVKNSRK